MELFVSISNPRGGSEPVSQLVAQQHQLAWPIERRYSLSHKQTFLSMKQPIVCSSMSKLGRSISCYPVYSHLSTRISYFHVNCLLARAPPAQTDKSRANCDLQKLVTKGQSDVCKKSLGQIKPKGLTTHRHTRSNKAQRVYHTQTQTQKSHARQA